MRLASPASLRLADLRPSVQGERNHASRKMRGRCDECSAHRKRDADERATLADFEPSRLSASVRQSNELTAQVLAHLVELEERMLHLELEFSSLFSYCVEALGMSERAAGRRVAAARVCRRLSGAFERIARGQLHLCALAPHLTAENATELLDACRGKTRRSGCRRREGSLRLGGLVLGAFQALFEKRFRIDRASPDRAVTGTASHCEVRCGIVSAHSRAARVPSCQPLASFFSRSEMPSSEPTS